MARGCFEVYAWLGWPGGVLKSMRDWGGQGVVGVARGLCFEVYAWLGWPGGCVLKSVRGWGGQGVF